MRYILVFFLLCCPLVGQEPKPVEVDSRVTAEIEFCSDWYIQHKDVDFYKGWNCNFTKMSEKEKQFFILYQEGRLESRLNKVERYVVITMRGTLEGSQIAHSIYNVRALLAADRETLIIDLMLDYPNLQTDLKFYAEQVTHYNEMNHLNEMSLFRPALP